MIRQRKRIFTPINILYQESTEITQYTPPTPTGSDTGAVTPPSGSSYGDAVLGVNGILSESQMKINAAYIIRYLRANTDWTESAIAGILGNMEHESTINPSVVGCWANYPSNATDSDSWWWYDYGSEHWHGYGLVQWTPGSKVIKYVQNELGLSPDDLGGQCAFLIKDLYDSWISSGTGTNRYWPEYSVSYKSFCYDTSYTPEFCAGCYEVCYERPYSVSQTLEKRQTSARKWYNYAQTIT